MHLEMKTPKWTRDIFVMICKHLLICNIFTLSLVNKQFHKWVKHNIRNMHNCKALSGKSSAIKIKNGCVKISNTDGIDRLFQIAVENGHIDVCKWLTQFNPNIHAGHEYAFCCAASKGYLNICKWLLQYNPNIHVYNDCAFRCAAAYGHLEVCKWLLQFNPNVRTENDWAFRHAAENGHFGICKWLLQFDIDKKLINKYIDN